MRSVIIVCMIGAVALAGAAWAAATEREATITGSGAPRSAEVPPVPGARNPAVFGCEPRKYCQYIDTCAEAIYRLQPCEHFFLDPDGDGVPCEALCPEGS